MIDPLPSPEERDQLFNDISSAYPGLLDSHPEFLRVFLKIISWAVDWGCELNDRRWTRSFVGDYDPTMLWRDLPSLDRFSYEALLKKFGLEEWPEEFPLNAIIKMSPAQLAGKRRIKEKELNLPRLEIISDNIDWQVEDKDGKRTVVHLRYHAEEYN